MNSGHLILIGLLIAAIYTWRTSKLLEKERKLNNEEKSDSTK